MYSNVSTNFKNAILSNGREFDVKVLIGSIEYGKDVISDISISGSLVSKDIFTFGDTVSSVLELTLLLPEKTIISELSTIKPYISLKVNGTWESVFLGTFYIDTIDKSKRTSIKIKAYDAMGSDYKLNRNYISTKLTFPTKAQQVLTEICEKNNIECIETMPDMTIPDFDELLYNKSYREAIGMLACIYGGYAKIERGGALKFYKHEDSGYSYTNNNTISLSKSERKFKCTKISCKVDNDTTLTVGSGDDNSTISITCPIMTQERLNTIFNFYNGMSYYGSSATLQGNPLHECGDIITVEDYYGDEFTVYINEFTLKYSGSLTMTVESKFKPSKKAPLKGSVRNQKANGGVARDPDAIHKNDPIDGSCITGSVPESVLTPNIINAINASIEKIDADRITVENLDASVIVSGQIDVNRLTAHVIESINASISSAVINEAKIGELTASHITSGSISTALLQANVVEAIEASIDKISANSINVRELSVEVAEIINLQTGNIVSQIIDTINLNVSDTINTNKLNANEIAVNTANVINLNVDNIKSQIIRTINASIENAVIDQAKIGNISANKITSGDIQAERLTANVIESINLSSSKIKTERLEAITINAD